VNKHFSPAVLLLLIISILIGFGQFQKLGKVQKVLNLADSTNKVLTQELSQCNADREVYLNHYNRRHPNILKHFYKAVFPKDSIRYADETTFKNTALQ
jgi:hypothetical protein